MIRRTVGLVLALLALLPASAAVRVAPTVAQPAPPRSLSLEERIRAQEAIERVYYSHQIGATRPFEEAVPRAVLEGKVRRYLQETVALERFWKTPITDQMLQRELERMAQGSRMPERLVELYAALGNDPFLIKECLARASLADRLARNFYAFDSTFHAGARTRADELQRRLVSGEIAVTEEHPDRTVVEFVVRVDGTPPGAEAPAGPEQTVQPARIELSAEEFAEMRARWPESASSAPVLEEEREAFVVRALLDGSADSARVASYFVAKGSWDSWWESVRGDLGSDAVAPVASISQPAPRPGHTPGTGSSFGALGRDDSAGQASAPCPVGDAWDNGSLDDLPANRAVHTAVWTGSWMIIWGGARGYVLGDGGRYDPATDTWSRLSNTGAPSPRSSHSAVWTGDLMVVWGGGVDQYTAFNTGGRYDPTTDTWSPTSTTGAPTGRYAHTAVWTGSLMVVWGGYGQQFLNSGGRYDPGADTWTPTSTAGAPAVRYGHTAVWTGSLMVVWGGLDYFHSLGDGGRYDPVTDTWSATSNAGAPFPRGGHTAIWTGSLMVVWGAPGDATGGRYDPATDRWTPISTLGAPSPRIFHTAVWTGSQMVVWGGAGTGMLNTGGRYDPATDRWTPISTLGTPAARYLHTAVWTGSLMVVWGGANGGEFLNSGARYHIATDTWTPTSTAGAPPGNSQHTAVWTGSLMVVWGGTFLNQLVAGDRYDPATDSWAPVSTVGAPSRRVSHTAVWTGNLMVVWGGSEGFHALNDGGRYDPIADSWTSTSTAGAPSPRRDHTAVWTGSQMVVWGGSDLYQITFFITGGRYDPTTDLWESTSTVGAPSPRYKHTVTWTGSLMVVWGGFDVREDVTVDTGGRYDPASDSWTPTTIVGVPFGRFMHAAVWTGVAMVVWGGFNQGGGELDTGGRYDPESDSWTPTSTVGGPTSRWFHTAVWTGEVMVVWGGYSSGSYLNTGGRYDPASDFWAPTSIAEAPLPRIFHTAVWTGNMMVVWGGHTIYNSGGRYTVGAADSDSDGLGDTCDNCPADPNPDQADTDRDALGDACDGCPLDAANDEDGDEVCGNVDNCRSLANPDQANADRDALGDPCDRCPQDPLNDYDRDQLCANVDACPDSNLGGRVVLEGCDSGVPNALFPDGCSLQDRVNACGVGAENHGAFVSCVAHLTGDLRDHGALTGRQAGRIQTCAAHASSVPVWRFGLR